MWKNHGILVYYFKAFSSFHLIHGCPTGSLWPSGHCSPHLCPTCSMPLLWTTLSLPQDSSLTLEQLPALLCGWCSQGLQVPPAFFPGATWCSTVCSARGVMTWCSRGGLQPRWWLGGCLPACTVQWCWWWVGAAPQSTPCSGEGGVTSPCGAGEACSQGSEGGCSPCWCSTRCAAPADVVLSC